MYSVTQIVLGTGIAVVFYLVTVDPSHALELRAADWFLPVIMSPSLGFACNSLYFLCFPRTADSRFVIERPRFITKFFGESGWWPLLPDELQSVARAWRVQPWLRCATALLLYGFVVYALVASVGFTMHIAALRDLVDLAGSWTANPVVWLASQSRRADPLMRGMYSVAALVVALQAGACMLAIWLGSRTPADAPSRSEPERPRTMNTVLGLLASVAVLAGVIWGSESRPVSTFASMMYAADVVLFSSYFVLVLSTLVILATRLIAK